jgi:hypothetical protein
MRTFATVFAACLMLVPPAVWGQGLIANPNPLTINVGFGSSSVTQNVNITFNGSPAAITGLSASTTTGQNWLQAFSPSTGVVTTTVNPSSLSGSYFGTVIVNTTDGTVSFSVNLTVGLGNTSGLVASPSVINFNIPVVGSGTPSQTVSITFNGVPVTISNLSTNVNGTWLLVSNTGTGVVTVGINGATLTMGSYIGTVFANTTAGTLSFQVNLTVGSPPPATPVPPSLILVLTGLAAVGLYQMRRRRFSVAIR